MKRRIGGIFLALALCLTLLPTAALAADGQPAIQAGLGSITGYSTGNGYNYIYYGTWQDKPIKWRVLDTKANTGADCALFLLTDECMGSYSSGYIRQIKQTDTSGRAAPYRNGAVTSITAPLPSSSGR